MNAHYGMVALFVVTACGSEVTLQGDDAAPPPPTAPAPSPTPTNPPVNPVPEGLCGIPASAPLLTTLDDRAFRIADASGELRDLDVGLDELPEGTATVRSHSDHDFVATFATVVQATSPPHADSIVTLFDADGVQRWRVAQPGFQVSGVALDENGTLIVQRYSYESFASGHVVIRDGVVTPFPADLTPIDGFVADGVVRVLGDQVRGFHDIVRGVTTWASDAEPLSSTVAWAHGFLSLFTSAGGSPALALHRYDGSQTMVLSSLDEDAANLQLRAPTERYILLSSNQSGRSFRVDLSSGVVLELPVTTPLGPPPDAMAYCTPLPALASNGDVVLVGGRPALTFQAFDPLSSNWTSLGEPVRAVETTNAFERDGTWILEGVVGTFCPGPVGDGDVGLAGSSTQVVNVALGAHHVIEEIFPYAEVAAGGRCVGYATTDGVHVLDLATGDDVRVGAGSFSWWRR